MRYTRGELLAALQSGGWYVRFEAGVSERGTCLSVLPTGYIIVTASDHGRYFRRPLVADQSDTNRVATCISNLVASSPEFSALESYYRELGAHIGATFSGSR